MSNHQTRLIVLRGPSGSGKSSVARAIRAASQVPMALIEQDYFRRLILQEKGSINGLNIELIKRTVLFLLDNGVDVIMEGIFSAGRYGSIFVEILQRHPHNNYFFYFDISFEETLRRHQTKPNKNDFGEKEMHKWYKGKDFLGHISETTIPESNTLEETVDLILRLSGQ